MGNEISQVEPLVLVIDDDETISELLRAALVKAKYKPILAYDGFEGEEMARCAKPIAIILDWIMPQKSGIDVLQALKCDQKTQHIPIMMLTSKRMTSDVLTAVQSGAAEYVVKPFEMSEFITRFHKMMYQFGDKSAFQEQFEVEMSS